MDSATAAQQAVDAAPTSNGIVDLWPGLVIAAAMIATILSLRIVLRRRSAAAPVAIEPNLRIDVNALSQAGPESDSPRLELYHVPVRLGVLVLAPTGRGSELPANDTLPTVVEQIVPGLMEVLRVHQPLFQRWPAQLSTQGFSTTFFAHLALPGDCGRSTPWCALAGRVEFEGKKYLVGVAVCAHRANSFGQIIVERETDWLDMLRVVNLYGHR